MIAPRPALVRPARLKDRPYPESRLLEVHVTLPADCGHPTRRFHQAEQHPQGRGLARAVRPEEARNLARLGEEGHVIHDLGAAVLLGEPADVDPPQGALLSRDRLAYIRLAGDP